MDYHKRQNEIRRKADFQAMCVVAITLLLMVASWCTHIGVAFANEQWLLLIAGAIAFPIGMVHGIGIWFGIF
jgi:hypothetical protein